MDTRRESGRRFEGQCHLRSDNSMRSRSEVSLPTRENAAGVTTNFSSVSIGCGSSIPGPSLSAQVRMSIHPAHLA